jgi:signal transduction histidine kinase
LLGLIGNVLDVYKINSEKFSPILSPTDFRLSMQKICNIYTNQVTDKGLYLNMDIDKRLPKSIIIDSPRITQIIINMLSNAVKFTETGGINLNVI